MGREHFLLDTGPLLDFLVLRYEAESKRPLPRGTFQFQALLTQLDREDFEKFVTANRGYLVTSSGVVTEMYGRLQRVEKGVPEQARKGLKRVFWDLVCATFRELGMDERAVPVVEMTGQVLADFGPTDAGLFELAMRSVKVDRRVVVVLTADRGLLELCRRHAIQAEYVPDRLEKFRKAV